MNRWWLPASLLLIPLAGWTLFAQTSSATLFVIARDPTGALLPGVSVELLNENTLIRYASRTGDNGSLVLPLLPPGTYTLTGSLSGFRTEVIQGVRMEVGVKATLELVLLPGSPRDEIVVSADLTTLQPGNSTIGEVFDNRTLITLPVSDREFLQLALLAPGVSPPAPGSRLSSQSNSSGINVAGARESSNNFLLDGVDNNDLFLNRIVVTPSLDAVHEFTVLANNYDAEYGRSAGAQVNVALKSGSREVHGSIYNFFRHSALDARNFFARAGQEKPLLRQNQFGGTLGGPFGETANFYFISAEGIRSRQAETRASNVPTALEKSGDFSLSPMTITDPFTGQPFEGNRIPAGRIHPSGQAVAGMFPDPNQDIPGQNFLSSPIGRQRTTQLTVKTDHHFSQENPFFLRYSIVDDFQRFPFASSGPNLPGFGISVLDRGQNLAFGSTQALSAHFLNDFRFGWNRLNREVFPENRGLDGFARLGIQGPELSEDDQGFPFFVLPGYESLGDDPNIPVVRRTRTWHFSDSLSLYRGRHYLKAGGEFRHYGSDGFNHLFARGQLIFQGVFTGDALADLLLGFPTLGLLAVNDNRQALRTWSYNFYFNDDWKLFPRLTVNLGLRYEFNTPPVDVDDRMSIFDLQRQVVVPVGRGGVSRSGLRSDRNDWAPRVGFSWNLSERGTVVLRGGYGVFYDAGTLIQNSALYFNPPQFQLDLFFPGQQLLTLDNPFPREQGFTPAPSLNTLNPDFPSAYSQHWSLSLEGALSRFSLAARYVGSKGTHLVLKRNLNQPAPGAGFLDARRPIPGFSDILLIESGANASYHSLQLRAETRSARGFSLLGSYTLSKAIDNTSSFLESDGDTNTPQDSRNLAAERGLSNFDVRHRLTAAFFYELPALLAHPLFRDWRISSIFAAQTGRPFTPRLSFDNSNTGNVGGFFGSDRPNRIGDATLEDPGPEEFFNTAAFEIPAPFTFGNSGRNVLDGPSFVSLDAALSKLLFVRDERRLELRAEVYNAFNRPNFDLPVSFIDRPTFGRIQSARSARQLQLALRFSF